MHLRTTLFCVLCLLSFAAQAQDAAQSSTQNPAQSPVQSPGRGLSQDSAPPSPLSTLHVYTNLIQLPVLVLSPDKQPLPPINPATFFISLDGGRPFRPTHVRPEGDDPITLAILLEIPSQRDLHTRLADSLAALVPTSLHPRDRVAFYSFECNQLRAQTLFPADGARLRTAVNNALQPLPNPITRQQRTQCGGSTGFLNAVGYVTRDLATLPGRRVLLALTDGYLEPDGDRWTAARSAANSVSIAIFAVSESADTAEYRPRTFRRYEDPLNSLCELTGGLVFHTPVPQLPQTLKLFVRMLRERYIVEFPRPRQAPSGLVDLLVTVAKRNLFIRPSGISVPIAAPEEVANPAAPPPDPATTPELGPRHPLPPR